MDEKISLEAIALYSDAFAEKVLAKFFDKKERITGKEILSLCEVQQVNLFVIRELFRLWRDETKKLKSPYFDYEHQEVKEALEQYLGVLSQHISIDRAHFAPLLKKAVSATLLVIFNPYDYFSVLISGVNNKLEVAAFRDEIKYLKINKAPLEKLVQQLEDRNVTAISGNEAFAMLDQILEAVNFTPEDVEPFFEQFSKIEKLNPEGFYVKKAEPAPKPVDKPAPTKTRSQEEKKQRATLADNFQKIDKIKDRLTINQKFMFTKVLFNGDFELFSKAVDDIDRQDSIAGALKYISQFEDSWDRESDEYLEFIEIIEKRFG
ncbi:MAG: hypothetical protein HRU69_02775 [Flammeovirgaceae bacterium]|nr:MAG: hypothetical protein HRU69_02775 [Flammeovirgaceae bacterium]